MTSIESHQRSIKDTTGRARAGAAMRHGASCAAVDANITFCLKRQQKVTFTGARVLWCEFTLFAISRRLASLVSLTKVQAHSVFSTRGLLLVAAARLRVVRVDTCCGQAVHITFSPSAHLRAPTKLQCQASLFHRGPSTCCLFHHMLCSLYNRPGIRIWV